MGEFASPFCILEDVESRVRDRYITNLITIRYYKRVLTELVDFRLC